MITPRATRLVRVPDLRAMHAAIARVTAADPSPRTCAVIVPTRGAAEELRRTLENARLAGDRAASAAMMPPDLVTRDDFYARLRERLPDVPPLLTGFEREVMLRRAAGDVVDGGAAPPFHVRAGLVAEMLRFYDELRRRDRSLDDFARLTVASLEPSADVDRGAERMLRQTHFLTAALGRFERHVAESGGVDEHGLRALLLAHECRPPYTHVVVTVADQAADARGLWPVDFDLLTRMPGVLRIDVVCTEAVLTSGFHERLHHALPGIEEEPGSQSAGEREAPVPVLVVPEPRAGDEPARWFTARDREEELVAIARAVKRDGHGADATRAVVFQRPLPYLYLAKQVFADAGLAYHALDALPLAAEPFVAALDLAFTVLLSDGTRASLTALLRSPHWSFTNGAAPLRALDIAGFDELLQDLKYLGGFERLSSIAQQAQAGTAPEGGRRRRSLWARAAPAVAAAAAAAAELRDAAGAPSAALQVDRLIAFIKRHERLPAREDGWRARHLRARAAVLAALEELRDAHARHDDTPLGVADLAAAIRRWIEGQTFSPRTGSEGIRLLDAQAAAYADVDDARLVGLVESDWPERSRRSIFYPQSLLAELGWPSETDRLSASRARFVDLLSLPRERISASTFTLEDDSIVPPSTFLEEVEGCALPVAREPQTSDVRTLAHEALSEEPIVPSAVGGAAADWLALRVSRSPGTSPAYRGASGPRRQDVYAVSYVERFLECPFKYFAAHVLQLAEERDDETGLTPQERGQFLHDVFEEFFARWHGQEGGAITTANAGAALALFAVVAEERLSSLNEADRGLERTLLLGSAVAPGLAERAFAFEIDHQSEVVERLLEYQLEGVFQFRSGEAARDVAIRAKADRIDLLADGTLRIIDYKLGRAPKRDRALQLPVYGVCAEQKLNGYRGRQWKLGRAAYVAFREKNPYVPLGGTGSLEGALAEGQARFLQALDGIEAGAFAVDPAEPYRCQWCAYPSVCRKDYVGDE